MVRFPPLFAMFLTAIAVAAVAFSMFPEALGAHPWWAHNVVLMGGGGGMAMALAGRWVRPDLTPRLAFFAVMLLLAGAAAHLGRLEFAASYAESALAGRAWFFGWIAASAAGSALFASILMR